MLWQNLFRININKENSGYDSFQASVCEVYVSSFKDHLWLDKVVYYLHKVLKAFMEPLNGKGL